MVHCIWQRLKMHQVRRASNDRLALSDEIRKAKKIWAASLLLTCSCSPAISPQAFEKLVLDAARSLRKSLPLLKVGGAGREHSLDLAYPEERYLKWLLLYVL